MSQRPSFLPKSGHVAVALSAVALTFALGVPGHAGGLLTGKDIKNGTISGKDIKDDALRGGDILESSLALSVGGAQVQDHSLTGADYALAYGQKAYTAGDIAAGFCNYTNVPVGVDLTGAVVEVMAPVAVEFSQGIEAYAQVSTAPNSFNLVVCNRKASGLVNVPASTYTWIALR